MKAVLLTAIDQIACQQQTMPTVAPGKSIVKVLACGICGTDRHIYKGEYPSAKPVILGHEFGGVIETPSEGSKFSKGDLVSVDPNIVCGVCIDCKAGNQTNAGQTFAEAVAIAQEAIAVGVNCTPPELINELLLSAKSDKPFVVYPNSGRIWDAVKKEWTGSAGVGFDEKLVGEWRAAGAQYIGGCCGIGPTEIEQINLSY